MRIRILWTFMVAIALPAWATTYKCETVGQVIYSDKPCPKGENKQMVLDVASPNGKTQATMTSEERVEFEKKQAEALEKERMKKLKAEEKENSKKSPKREKKKKEKDPKPKTSKKKMRIKVAPKASIKKADTQQTN